MENTITTMKRMTTVTTAYVAEPATHVVELPRLSGTRVSGSGVARCFEPTTIDAFPGTHAWGPPT